MLVNDIIKAQECCFIRHKSSCVECPLREVAPGSNCQTLLAQFTIEKLVEMSDLLANQNFSLIEQLQEEKQQLATQVEKVLDILKK